MNSWRKISLGGIGLFGVGAGLVFWSGASRWKKVTRRIVEELKRSALPGKNKTVSFEDLEELPAPVARYFKFALKEGQPAVRTARIRHAGEFNFNNRWIPFESDEYFSAAPPVFVWDARMKMNSLMSIAI